eukprot:scaffold66049_cov28-Tisochrysis_lutea.AAC.8
MHEERAPAPRELCDSGGAYAPPSHRFQRTRQVDRSLGARLDVVSNARSEWSKVGRAPGKGRRASWLTNAHAARAQITRPSETLAAIAMSARLASSAMKPFVSALFLMSIGTIKSRSAFGPLGWRPGGP